MNLRAQSRDEPDCDRDLEMGRSTESRPRGGAFDLRGRVALPIQSQCDGRAIWSASVAFRTG